MARVRKPIDVVKFMEVCRVAHGATSNNSVSCKDEDAAWADLFKLVIKRRPRKAELAYLMNLGPRPTGDFGVDG